MKNDCFFEIVGYIVKSDKAIFDKACKPIFQVYMLYVFVCNNETVKFTVMKTKNTESDIQSQRISSAFQIVAPRHSPINRKPYPCSINQSIDLGSDSFVRSPDFKESWNTITEPLRVYFFTTSNT